MKFVKNGKKIKTLPHKIFVYNSLLVSRLQGKIFYTNVNNGDSSPKLAMGGLLMCMMVVCGGNGSIKQEGHSWKFLKIYFL